MVLLMASAPVKDTFTPAEQQQISIETPGLFIRSNAFSVDFSSLKSSEYSFPLPVGKVEQVAGESNLRIVTKKGDAVKAMFDGVVRLSRKDGKFGNVIVIRHPNGLETVYGDNAENLVKVGQAVKAGQSIAIVRGREGRFYCTFAIMVNGGRVNPETLIELASLRLRKQEVVFRKSGSLIAVSVSRKEKAEAGGSVASNSNASASAVSGSNTASSNTSNRLDLRKLKDQEWAYPLPGCKVISNYGRRGRRMHTGVDLKTKAGDEIHAAFDGEVTQSGPYYGYGNYIVIRHFNGLETHYSHQSRNHVRKGQRVKAGEVIGRTGRTGRATTEHLHFEAVFKGRRFDPGLLFNHATHQLRAHTLVVKGGVVKAEK